MKEGMYSLHVETFCRRRKMLGGWWKHFSVIGKLAYQRGEAIDDEYTGVKHDYRQKSEGVLNKALLGWKGLPKKWLQGSKIWNMVNSAERRKNAKICRTFILALPHQLSLADQWACLLRFAQYLAERYRTIADVAHHAPNPAEGHDNRNWHGHILMPRREVTAEHGYTASNRTFRALDKRWLSGAELKILRAVWAQILNEMLELRGIDVRVDHRSFKDRGIERIPGVHRGPGGQAMGERGERPESKPQLDKKGRVINWPLIDQGRTRDELNFEVDDLNELIASFGPMKLIDQITHINAWMDSIMEQSADLEAIIPAAMLPHWARLKVEYWRYKLEAFLARAWKERTEEAEERQERKRALERRMGLHEQIREKKEQIRQLEAARSRRQALLGFYTRVQANIAMRAPIERDYLPPPREISRQQMKVELHFKAESARAKVPPEYRPRIERPVPKDSARAPPAGQGAAFTTAARAPPPDNGGKAQRPPPLTGNFNDQAEPESAPHKAKVKVGFGPK